MYQSPSRIANNSTASQEIPLILWNPKVHLQAPAICFCPEPDQSIPCLPIPLLKDPILILSSIYAWVLQVQNSNSNISNIKYNQLHVNLLNTERSLNAEGGLCEWTRVHPEVCD